MKQDDLFSLYTYNGNKLRCTITRKKVENVNFDENMDTFLNAKFNDTCTDNKNVLQRLNEYLRSNHHGTLKYLRSENYKNLVVAFTTESEWKDSELDTDTIDLIHSLCLDCTFVDTYNLNIIIIIFPYNSLEDMRDYIEWEDDNMYFTQTITNTFDIYGNMLNDFHMNLENLIHPPKLWEESETLAYLCDEIKTKNYPISILNLKEEKCTIEDSIEFVRNQIKVSKNYPLKCAFLDIHS